MALRRDPQIASQAQTEDHHMTQLRERIGRWRDNGTVESASVAVCGSADRSDVPNKVPPTNEFGGSCETVVALLRDHEGELTQRALRAFRNHQRTWE